MYKVKKNTRSALSRTKKFSLIAVIVIAVSGITLAALEYTDTTYILHDRPTTHETQKNTPNRTAGQNTKGEDNSSSTNNTSNTQANGSTNYNPASEDKSIIDTTSNDTTLIAPSGNFVNSHRINVNSAADTQQSVCVTTAGATCEIIFSKDSTTKTLGELTTDRGGAVYWTWSPKSVGLTVGQWKITAKAKLGSQTLTATDSIDLEVTQ